MNRLHSLRSQAAALLLASLACAVHAAPHVTLYDEAPKYPADFKHFDYVNPDAPKGGTFRQAGFGGFDSLNPFINKGVPADDIGLIYDTLARAGGRQNRESAGQQLGTLLSAPRGALS